MEQKAYIKASNTEARDFFGYAVTMSSDGTTLAVGAYQEDSGSRTNQNNNFDNSAGSVYVFVKTADGWAQQAYIKANQPDSGDNFGIALSISGDGKTLAVGANNQGSLGTGAVYIFEKTGTDWNQKNRIVSSNPNNFDEFGFAVSLSSDGNTLAVGATGEDSNSTIINAGQNNNDAEGAGAVYVFARNGEEWLQQAYIKASNTDAADAFGYAVTLSANGNKLAVSAPHEESNATGINGVQDNNNENRSGAVYVFDVMQPIGRSKPMSKLLTQMEGIYLDVRLL